MAAKAKEHPRGSGKWYVQVCKNGRTKLTKMRNRAEAEHKAKQVNAMFQQIDLGMVKAPGKSKPSFKEYASIILEQYYKPPKKSKSMYARYKLFLADHCPADMQNTPVDEVTRASIKKALLAYYNTGKAKRSVELFHTFFTTIFNHVVDDEYREYNPASGIMKMLNLPASDHEKNPMRAEEADLVLESFRNDAPAYYPFFLFLFRTGCRVGEAMALQWPDVNLRYGTARIRRTARDQHISSKPKTSSSRREIELSPQLAAVLKKMHRQYLEDKIKNPDTPPLVFRTADNRLFSQQTVYRVFQRRLSAVGLDARRVHDIRHTYASILLSRGVPVMYVSRQMGHKNIGITIDTYGTWIRDDQNSYVKLLDSHESEGYKTTELKLGQK